MADTIAAISTGNTISAIGIIRVSGANAIVVANEMFRSSSGMLLKDAESKYMHFGELRTADGILMDMCLCMISRMPDSYTGEDCVEFHCHGSPVVLSEVLHELYKKGVRHAEPGEFTKRAFLNGRMDLASAEAVIDLIESESPSAAYNAAGQLSGAVSVGMNEIYNTLVDIMAHFHATIDYPDEDIDDFKIAEYRIILSETYKKLQNILDTHDRGRLLKSGIPTAIIGRPNTGKSSLLNALLGYQRAIVTEIAGTTRDTIEEKILLGGVLLKLIDTAGLRASSDKVEQFGIERTLDAIKSSKLILLVFDGSEPLQEEDFEVLRKLSVDVPVIALINKSDLPSLLKSEALEQFDITETCNVSALTGEGINGLEAIVSEKFPLFSSMPTGELITNARQADAIMRAKDSVGATIDALAESVTPDAILTDIEVAITAIGEVTGITMREDIVSRIFERFCVGK